MKKWSFILLLLVVFLMSLPTVSSACDFCLLSQGISPLETLSGGGIRVNERYTLLNQVYRGMEKISNPGAKEEFWTTEFTGFYSITKDITLLAVVPLKKTSMNGELVINEDGTVDADPMKGDEFGLGDIAVLGRYSFFKRHTIDTTITVAGLLGIKLPTGKTNGKTDDGMEYLDSHIQLGTGSTDFLVGLSGSYSIQRFTISTNLLGTITTEGRYGDTKHQFGNALNYDLTAKYRVYPGVLASGPQLFLAIGVNGELRDREKVNGAKDPNSGGNTTYLSPGIQVVVAPHLVFELSYQYAIYHHLYGTQLGENYKMSGGVTYMF